MEIDFVVTWVDMDDRAWRDQFAKYSGLPATDNSRNETSEARFRDNGLLKYWFRGVEKFAPWVRFVHFVTCGQKPEWLDPANPKLRLVDHSDYIPEKFLPTFNSNVIEYWLHRIPDLTPRFAYFNDDCYIIDHLPRERFFVDGAPCDIATLKPVFETSQWARMLRNNLQILNANFDKREVMARDRDKWFDPSYGGKAMWNRLLKPWPRFTALRTPHNAQPYLKSTFEEVWAAAEDRLLEVSGHRFRSDKDLTPELFRSWQICNGSFHPYNTYTDTRMFPLVLRSTEAIKALREQSYKLVCLNDNVHIRSYDRVMGDLEAAFETILPDKSSFEL
jgi:hypothetical protein